MVINVADMNYEQKKISRSTALEASRVVKASGGTLWAIRVTNTSASAQYIQVHNTTTVPADTAVPIESIYVAAANSVVIPFAYGLRCDTGISISNSSTAATKTVGSADCWFSVDYE